MKDPSALLFVVFVLLVFLLMRRGARQRRALADQQAQLRAGIAVGAQVLTTSGLYARVVALEEDAVTLETWPGQRSRWDRRAVARVIDDPAGADGDAPGVGEGAQPAGQAADSSDLAVEPPVRTPATEADSVAAEPPAPPRVPSPPDETTPAGST